MTIENFNNLSQQQKIQLVFDADKITEKVDNEANYQLFRIENFFVETKISLEGKFKRSFTTYTVRDLPPEYVSEILLLPVVVLDDTSTVKESVKANTVKKAVLSYKKQ